MSRAVRRQQAATPRERPGRQQKLSAGGGKPPTRGARPVARGGESRRFRFLRVPNWIQDIVAELRKVTWPTWPETRYLSQVVIVVAVSVGLLLGLVDIFFNWFIDQLLLR